MSINIIIIFFFSEVTHLSSFVNFISLGAGLDAVLAFDITVAGRAVVNITSPVFSAETVFPEATSAGVSMLSAEPTARFSLERERTPAKRSELEPSRPETLPFTLHASSCTKNNRTRKKY
jgi:hypothetical protein